MATEEELAKQIEALEAELREREASLPAHSVRPEQMLVIEELETTISEKKRELDRVYGKAADGKAEGERD
jgi:CHASE3 domain sensor protein